MTKDSLGDRMKRYEGIPRIYVTPRMPIIIRVDGNCFHKYTKPFKKPWDESIQRAMTVSATSMIKEIQGANIAYIQSDEISIVLNTYKRFATSSWFDGNVQKIASVSASIVTQSFNATMTSLLSKYYSGSPGLRKGAFFDSRCFVIPREDVVNYFVWRQQDAIRNSVSGLAQSVFPAKQLHGKNVKSMKEMLMELDVPIQWETDVSVKNQRGWCVIKDQRDIIEDTNIPLFSEDREYINRFLVQEEV